MPVRIRHLPLRRLQSLPNRRNPRRKLPLRRRLLMKHGGEWDLAADWVPVWIGFGATWRNGDEPLPWAAHATLWRALDSFAEHVRFHRRLGGVSRLPLPEGVDL